MIHHGDALTVLRGMGNDSVNMCVTSPPYYGLRDYGVEGQIGLEETPELFIARLVEVFREVRRVLKPDGTLWVNMGDSYATGAGKVGNCPGGGEQGEKWRGSRNGHEGKHGYSISARGTGALTQPNRLPLPGLKPKDIIGTPWMLAFALRADGWWLRQDIIWHKPGVMPESVRDRCTKAHEYIFLLSKSAQYHYDADAIAEPSIDPESLAGMRKRTINTLIDHDAGYDGHRTRSGLLKLDGQRYLTRNRRSVWTMATCPTPEAHFATFPITLAETCILAGCPEGGTVLDPFAGAGTTWLACLKHGRQFVGIELNAEYIKIAKARARKYYPLLAEQGDAA